MLQDLVKIVLNILTYVPISTISGREMVLATHRKGIQMIKEIKKLAKLSNDELSLKGKSHMIAIIEDYQHLKSKGYTDSEIKAIWAR